jgi:hypothetical protein
LIVEPVEIQRLRQMLKASRSMLRELAIACARAEEELDRINAQPKEAQRVNADNGERRSTVPA